MAAKRKITKQQHEATETVSSASRLQGQNFPVRDRQLRVPVDSLQDIVNPGRVRVGAGVTRKAGENTMEFIRVDVQLEWPCEPTKKGLKDTYEFLSERVEQIIEDEIAYALERM